MKQNELYNAIAAKTGLTKGAVESVITALAETTTAALAEGDSVIIPGLVKIGTKERPARPGRNPATGEAIQIAAKTVATFKPVKALTDQIT